MCFLPSENMPARLWRRLDTLRNFDYFFCQFDKKINGAAASATGHESIFETCVVVALQEDNDRAERSQRKQLEDRVKLPKFFLSER